MSLAGSALSCWSVPFASKRSKKRSESCCYERFSFTRQRFEAIDRRFEAVDRRFDQVIAQSNRRFNDAVAQSNRRFDDAVAHSDKRFRAVIWTVGFGVALTSTLTTVFGLLA